MTTSSPINGFSPSVIPQVSVDLNTLTAQKPADVLPEVRDAGKRANPPNNTRTPTKKPVSPAQGRQPKEVEDAAKRANPPVNTRKPTTTSPKAPPKTAPVNPALPSPASAQAAPKSDSEVIRTTDALAKTMGYTVKGMATRPEWNPLHNPKAQAAWETLNKKTFVTTRGEWGVGDTGQMGKKGTLEKLYKLGELSARSSWPNLKSIGLYSTLGAAVGFNLNQLGGMTVAAATAQIPAGVVRDFAGVGLSQVKSNSDNVFVEFATSSLKAGLGVLVTVATNEGVRKINADLGPKPGMGKGMAFANVTVGISFKVLEKIEKAGWVGRDAQLGRVPDSGWDKLMSYARKGIAVGSGVAVSIGPVVWNELKAKNKNPWVGTAMTFLAPFAQTVVAESIITGYRDTRTPASAAVKRNFGQTDIAASDVRSNLGSGANPFELFDSGRSAAGKGKDYGLPEMKIAGGVLQLQDAIRQTPTTQNVRSNAEAAAVIVRANELHEAGKLPTRAKAEFENLVNELRRSGVNFGSKDVVSVVDNAGSLPRLPALTAAEQDFTRKVFGGAMRQDNIKQDNTGEQLVQTAQALTGIIWRNRVKMNAFLLFGSVLTDTDPSKMAPASKDSRNPATFPEFERLVKQRYGDAFSAMGVKAPADVTQQVKDVTMAALFFAVEGTVYNRKFDPRTTPIYSNPNGPVFFSALEKMKPAQVAEVKTQVNQMFGTMLKKEQKRIVDTQREATNQRKREAERAPEPRTAPYIPGTGGVGTPENGPGRRGQLQPIR
jgi:hypothetical protein